MLPLKHFPNKYTGCYRCPDNIRNFKVRIKIRKTDVPDGKIGDTSDGWTEKTFKWQIKVFSRLEKEIYSNAGNCLTDLEKRYHQNVTDAIKEEADDFLFTYTDEDDYCFEKVEQTKTTMNYLQRYLANLHINNAIQDKCLEFDNEQSILKAIDNPVISSTTEKMYVMADFGEYIETTWIQHQYPLCSITYQENNKLVYIYPDFTKSRPYLIQIHGESNRYYYCFIENTSDLLSEAMVLQEKELFKKLIYNNKSIKDTLVGKNFFLPPKNKLYLYMFFEILTAKNFEYPEIYVKYYLELPQNWTCVDNRALQGMTQVGYGRNCEQLVHFGYNFEVVLEYNLQVTKNLPRCPTIYFEIISKDHWDIYRTEGLAYQVLPINNPGLHEYNLNCFRFGCNGVVQDLRRFFIGDCRNYDDLSWIGVAGDPEGPVLNKYGVNTIGTGSLSLRLNILHQSQAFLDEFSEGSGKENREKMIFDKLNASSLIKSVEEVLMAFKKARKNMLEARKQL